jgi:Tol biopolymer transport system component
MKKNILCCLMFVFIGITHAQPITLLSDLIIATVPATHDRIIIRDVNTGESRILTFPIIGELHLWDFSPDGCRVLFTVDSTSVGMPKLYTARLDGSDVRDMVQFTDLLPNDWGVWEPTWSINGKIAFTMYRMIQGARGLEKQSHIAWIDETGGTPSFYSRTGREFTPAWSPDGAWLAYVSYDPRVPGADAFSTAVPTPQGQAGPPLPTIDEADLWVVSADGATKYQLTRFEVGSMRSPRWSPDSQIISFIYSGRPFHDTFWMVANSPGAILTRLSEKASLTLDHVWFPDGSAMLASVRNLRDVQQNYLWVIPLIGNADNSATIFIDDPLFAYTDFPRFSPDGRYLAFRNEYRLVIYDLSNGTWVFYDEDDLGNTPPVWSPIGYDGEGNC